MGIILSGVTNQEKLEALKQLPAKELAKLAKKVYPRAALINQYVTTFVDGPFAGQKWKYSVGGFGAAGHPLALPFTINGVTGYYKEKNHQATFVTL